MDNMNINEYDNIKEKIENLKLIFNYNCSSDFLKNKLDKLYKFKINNQEIYIKVIKKLDKLYIKFYLQIIKKKRNRLTIYKKICKLIDLLKNSRTKEQIKNDDEIKKKKNEIKKINQEIYYQKLSESFYSQILEQKSRFRKN